MVQILKILKLHEIYFLKLNLEFKNRKRNKKHEFAELIGDYIKEISDPNNREEYDQYLKQQKIKNRITKMYENDQF
ncbi:unnamed protein product [Paramecium sonneborni]|uniref:Uncharacterized protein n=1 Tax=Paramecium sonneborni TaxID=65129 RepID=A0A8S1PIP5_9CILI|nr:unnamed protein product [Paramecium sonneborni]